MKTLKHAPFQGVRRFIGIGVVAFVTLFTLDSCSPNTYTIASGTTYQSYEPPTWAPQGAAVAGVQYYYLPDYGMYYDLSSQLFWYNNAGIWASSAFLPSMYAGINLNSAYIVMLNQGIRRPWLNNSFYVRRYPAGYYVNRSGFSPENRILNMPRPSSPRMSAGNTGRQTYRNESARTYQARPQTRQSYQSFSTPRSYSYGGGGFRGGFSGGGRGGRH